jgi:2-keto-4-pentenoate hydratase/2-oxohepta-3-ene-1,7-dioic acid hydratase in catechol pathway
VELIREKSIVKLASFQRDGRAVLGLVEEASILDLAAAQSKLGGAALPATMPELIAQSPGVLDQVRGLASKAAKDDATLWRPLASMRILAPVPRPTKNVFCVGRNYKAHIEEGARARNREVVFPKLPEFFSKPPTAVIGNDDAIRLDPKATKELDYEVELAIVIGRTCRDVPIEKALDVVFGYTILNDVSARDLQFAHGILFKGKSLDTTCPIGPWIVTADEFGDPGKHRIGLRVNGETRQDSHTSDLLFNCSAIISSLSLGMTLEAGDMIATGTPSGVALGMTPQKWLQDGDVVEAWVEGIGTLRNKVQQVSST